MDQEMQTTQFWTFGDNHVLNNWIRLILDDKVMKKRDKKRINKEKEVHRADSNKYFSDIYLLMYNKFLLYKTCSMKISALSYEGCQS